MPRKVPCSSTATANKIIGDLQPGQSISAAELKKQCLEIVGAANYREPAVMGALNTAVLMSRLVGLGGRPARYAKPVIPAFNPPTSPRRVYIPPPPPPMRPGATDALKIPSRIGNQLVFRKLMKEHISDYLGIVIL